MASYYKLLGRTLDVDGNAIIANYTSTINAQGAWNPHEQHMAAATGVICAELEKFSPRDDVRIGRIGFDILGLIPFGDFSIITKIIRPGKTIELVEAQMQAGGKICIIARVWRMLTQDTKIIAGIDDIVGKNPEELPDWQGMQRWPGGFIKTIRARIEENNPYGRNTIWLNNDTNMVEGEICTDFPHLMGMVDTANGVSPRQKDKIEWVFPNLDLQIHLHRIPSGRWLGIDAIQQFGDDGIGLTSAILHDIHGPFGRSEQILTLRKAPV